MRKSVIVMLVLGLLGWVTMGQATAQVISSDGTQATVSQDGRITILTVPNTVTQVGVGIDFMNAKPMELPSVPAHIQALAQEDLIRTLTSQSVLSQSGSAPGEKGHGRMTPIRLGAPNAWHADADEFTTEEFGTNNHPFSTAKADLDPLPTNTSYPYRAAGKLFFNVGNSTFVCSASLIKRGVVVTAAHCVANFGQNQVYSNWQFVPGYRNGSAPFGVWTVLGVLLLTSYLNGTDSCTVAGIVCLDDVAVLVLNTSATGAYPGTATGWYSYGWDGFGFTGNWLAQITQIGYPNCLDNGAFMEVNNSYGYISSSLSYNIIIGSLMCGGSSGGPWLVNFGIRPGLTGTTQGSSANPNVVVGVTSWGYDSTSPKEQGASIFLSSNIVPLVNFVCTAVPAACS
jgi:V8-like Glu-specific endopeptidase